jgi:hypothetical protein
MADRPRRPSRSVPLAPDVVADLEAAGLGGVELTRGGADAADLTVHYATARTGARAVAADALYLAEILWHSQPGPIASMTLRPRAAYLQLVLLHLGADRLRQWFGEPACYVRAAG